MPPLALVRQRFGHAPPVAWHERLRSTSFGSLGDLRGKRIALGVGSRGISGLRECIRALVKHLCAQGARPFLVPAMGSHGGAEAAGQRAVLATYGINTQSVCLPDDALDDSMDVALLGHTSFGPVYFSQAALNSDGIIVVNRVKPHTDFRGALGSGLAKMLVVGLGKQAGAGAIHRAAALAGHEQVIRASLQVILNSAPVLGGLALIENAHHETTHVEFVPAASLATREPELLHMADAQLARLPFAELDLLIVDRLGKDISGTGMDPNVVGRGINGYSSELTHRPANGPIIRRIFVRELTPASHGNASGIGMADFTTQRFVEAIDNTVTFTNSLTSLSLQSAKLPIHFANDERALAAIFTTLGVKDLMQAKVARIESTLALEQMQASPAALATATNLDVLSLPRPFSFDRFGNLLALDAALA